MATITITRKPRTRTIRVEVDLDRWERLADALGFYRSTFLKTLKQSLKESRQGRVRAIATLRDLER